MHNPKYKLATFGRRLAAKLLDLGIGSLIILISGMVIGFLRVDVAWIMLALAIAIAYWLFGDAMNGQSIGKRLLGLKVIDFRHGYPCKPFESLTRNFLGFGWLRI